MQKHFFFKDQKAVKIFFTALIFYIKIHSNLKLLCIYFYNEFAIGINIGIIITDIKLIIVTVYEDKETSLLYFAANKIILVAGGIFMFVSEYKIESKSADKRKTGTHIATLIVQGLIIIFFS